MLNMTRASVKSIRPRMTHLENITTIGIMVREGLGIAYETALKTVDTILSLGLTPITVSPLKHRLAESVSEAKELKRKHVDIVAVVGGDGTILKAVRELDGEVPILGIAAGGRGILCEVKPNRIDEALKRIKNGEYILDERIRLSTSIGSKKLAPALNEVFITRISFDKGTPSYTIIIDELLKLNQRMDGLIVSTPTGSTGHSYTLGAPVIFEHLDAFLLTPICPISRMPPMVVPSLKVEVISNQSTNVVVDGQKVYDVDAHTSILVQKYEKGAIFIRFGKSFFRQLVNLGFS